MENLKTTEVPLQENDAVLELKEASYCYETPYITVEAVKKVSYRFEASKFYAIKGASGSGKTTLLSLMAGLALPTGGDLLYTGKSVLQLNLDKHRREHVAVIYQGFNLLEKLTVTENVMYPMELNKIKAREARRRAKEYLALVGLTEEEAMRFPSTLSGGQQQRVAIARALGTPAKVILADEPTGSLDRENSKKIVTLLRQLAQERGYCVIMVTHDHEVAGYADRILEMEDGCLVRQERGE
ncbi:putative ABC transport system ATP-binding protein [Anaerotaenia torta]|uniref:ABC transporter ATP-binding protein n=1 Tax=Anaerotaenia torta TaxID=433293 RepID=UPI003D260870